MDLKTIESVTIYDRTQAFGGDGTRTIKVRDVFNGREVNAISVEFVGDGRPMVYLAHDSEEVTVLPNVDLISYVGIRRW